MRKIAVVVLFFSLSLFAQETRRFTFHYAFTVRSVAPGQKLEVWFPRAESDPFQQVRIVSIKSGLPLKRTREPRFGNGIFYAETPKATRDEYTFDVAYQVVRFMSMARSQTTRETAGCPSTSPKPGSTRRRRITFSARTT
jgi:hypothetical protein